MGSELDARVQAYAGRRVADVERGLKKIRSTFRGQGVLASYRAGCLYVPGSSIGLKVNEDHVIEVFEVTGDMPAPRVGSGTPREPGTQPRQRRVRTRDGGTFEWFTRTPPTIREDDLEFADNVAALLSEQSKLEIADDRPENLAAYWFSWSIPILRSEAPQYSGSPGLDRASRERAAAMFIGERLHKLKLYPSAVRVIVPSRENYTPGKTVVLLGVGPIDIGSRVDTTS